MAHVFEAWLVGSVREPDPHQTTGRLQQDAFKVQIPHRNPVEQEGTEFDAHVVRCGVLSQDSKVQQI